MSANGGDALTDTYSGGGSGGSIRIQTTNWQGTGTISAAGGRGNSYNSQTGGSGGGGRIAVYFTSNTFGGTITAARGLGTSQAFGGPGTIFTQDQSSGRRKLIINNIVNNVPNPNYVTTITDYRITRGSVAWLVDPVSEHTFDEISIGGLAQLVSSTISLLLSTFENYFDQNVRQH